MDVKKIYQTLELFFINDTRTLSRIQELGIGKDTVGNMCDRLKINVKDLEVDQVRNEIRNYILDRKNEAELVQRGADITYSSKAMDRHDRENGPKNGYDVPGVDGYGEPADE